MKFLLLYLFCLLSLLVNGQKQFEVDWRKEAAIIGGSAVMVGSSYLIDARRPPLEIPRPGALPPTINRFDRSALQNYSLSAKNASDVFFYGLTLAPLSILTSSRLKGSRAEYFLLYGEVVALNGGFTFLTKSAVDRKRPYFYNSVVPTEERQAIDARKSFFSGHASHTAALSFFSAKVFSELYPESDWKYVVWTSAAILPAATAFLRVEAGRHFPTDVIAGYGVGAGIGLLIPYLHRKKDSSVAFLPLHNGFYFQYTF